MGKIALCEDVSITPLDNNFIVFSSLSEKYCLVDKDAYILISFLRDASDENTIALYKKYEQFWEQLRSYMIVKISE